MSRGDLYYYKGKYYTAMEISREFKIPISTFRNRIRKGVSVEKAIETENFGFNENFKSIKCKPESGLPEDWLSLPLEVIKERALKNLEV